MHQMTTIDPAALLAEIAALSRDERAYRLHALGDPEVLLESLGDPEVLLESLSEEMDRLATDDVGQGVPWSEMLVGLADEIGLPAAQAATRGAHAMALAYAGRFDDALAACDEAVTIAEAAGLAVAAARARLASVHALSELDRYDDAIAAGKAARAALESAGEPALAARADISLGAVYDKRDDPARALRHYDRALPALSADPVVAAQIESNRGVALIGLDEFARAETAFRDAVAAFGASGIDWAAAIAEGNLAYLATRQGRLEQALHHFERARRGLERDESPADLARLLAEQADAMAQLGMPDEARQTYERVLPNLETHGMALEAAQTRAGLGRVLVHLGRLDAAQVNLDTAAVALDRLGQHVARARLDVVRAELAVRRGSPGAARVLLDDALETLAPRPPDAVVARERLARLDLEEGDVSAAEDHVATALPMAERLDHAPLLARLFHARSLARRARGDMSGSLADVQKAVDFIERIRGGLPAERFRTAFLGSHREVYEDAVLAALDSDRDSVAGAFALVERAKSRALLDVVGDTLDLVEAAQQGTPDPAEAELLATLVRLRGELNWHYARFDDVPPDSPAASLAVREEWRTTVHDLELELAALEDRLATASGVAGLYAPPLDLEQALDLVPARTALVEYFVAGDETIAFVLRDGHAAAFRRLATAADLDERVGRVQFQIGRAAVSAGRTVPAARVERQRADARRELGALHEILIAPLAAAIAGAERLLIVPHGALHTLPFHALWDGERYLIEQHEIAYAPSASVLSHMSRNQMQTPATVPALVVGVPDALAPRIETEALQVASTLGVAPLLGEEATVERVTRDAPTCGVVHLACHGRFSPDRPMASGLKLADRWLTVRDVYAPRLRAALVTLSACDTGRATVSGGDELAGLVSGFIATGAGSLLMSLWVVNDECTTELMQAFYGSCLHGASPAAALRGAQCALLERMPHPASWAPFMLGGLA